MERAHLIHFGMFRSSHCMRQYAVCRDSRLKKNICRKEICLPPGYVNNTTQMTNILLILKRRTTGTTIELYHQTSKNNRLNPVLY